MREYVTFCAGANIRDSPGKNINILLNTIDDFHNETSIDNAHRLLHKVNPKNTILDPGGMNVLSAEKRGIEIIHDKSKPTKYMKKINFTSEHNIEAAKEFKTHIMMTPDFPVRKIKNPKEQEREFRRKMKLNTQWAIEMSELRQKHCPETRLFIPVQAYNLKQLEVFVKSIRHISFDGFSIPARALKLKDIALFFVSFYQMGIKQIHLLGVAEFYMMALLAYAARTLFHWASSDSQTWKYRARYSTFSNPNDLIGEPLTQNTVINKDIKNNCTCWACKERTFAYIKNLPYKERRTFFGCHAFYNINKAGQDLFKNAGSPFELQRYLIKKSRYRHKVDEFFNILCLIDMFKDSDIKELQALLA